MLALTVLKSGDDPCTAHEAAVCATSFNLGGTTGHCLRRSSTGVGCFVALHPRVRTAVAGWPPPCLPVTCAPRCQPETPAWLRSLASGIGPQLRGNAVSMHGQAAVLHGNGHPPASAPGGGARVEGPKSWVTQHAWRHPRCAKALGRAAARVSAGRRALAAFGGGRASWE